MSGLQDLCEKYFGSRDLYDVLRIPKSANEKQVRKAYHKLSLLVHPDRVEENKKIEATEKFKVLGKVHSILSDKEKKSLYDETGIFGEESDDAGDVDWSEYWRSLFKKITVQDINNYEKNYKGSDEELEDLKRAYLDGKGDMDFILEAVPFTNTEEEPRLRELLQKLIDGEEVPEFLAFTNETPRKRERRKRKWEKEAKESARIKEEKGLDGEEDDLTTLIRQRQQAASYQMNSFFDSIVEKYVNKKTGTPKKKIGKKKKSQ